MIRYVTQRAVKVNQGLGRLVEVEGTLKSPIKGEGPVAGEAENSVHVTVTIANNGQRVNKAQTESEREDRQGPVRQSQT